MEEDIFKTIAAPAEGLFKSKGSRFLSFAFPVASEEEAKENLTRLKAKYHDARHHCFAWVMGRKKEQFRSSDDREPSGTAGKPILGQIHSSGLTNIEVVVVRYFGGTLLGTGGLIEAYREASRDALAHATVIEKTENSVFLLSYPYIHMNEVLKLVKDEKAEILSSQYDEEGQTEVSIRMSRADSFLERARRINGLHIHIKS